MSDKKPITGTALMGNPDIARFLTEMPAAKLDAPPTLAQEPSPAVAAVPPPPPPQPDADAEQARMNALVDETLNQKPLDPQESYLKGLERVQVSRDDAAKIVDAMLFHGFYEEEVVITRRLKVKFRTRSQEAMARLNDAIDSRDPKYNGTLFQLIAEYNVAASLRQYGPHVFDVSTKEGFDQALKYVTSLPTPVFQLLATKLSKFDEKLTTVMAEGAELFF